jgi:hypothetical protein
MNVLSSLILISLEKQYGMMMGARKRQFVQNFQDICMVDTVIEELVRNKSIIEACTFLRSHEVHHDQQNKDKATRQVNSISQSCSAT